MKIYCFAGGLLLAVCSHVFAAPVLNVVLTGDSITANDPAPMTRVGYADEFSSLIATVPSLTSDVVGKPGLSAIGYRDGKYHEQVIDAINASSTPDVIVFMLGVNNALRANSTANPTRAEDAYDSFRSSVNATFNDFDLSAATRVIVLSILPVNESQLGWLGNDGPDTNVRITGTGANTTDPTDVSFGYNPWLEKEVADRNVGGGMPTYEYVDLNTGFNTMFLDTDGLHLTDMDSTNDPFGAGMGTMGLGQEWLAQQVLSVTAVPEPSAFGAVGLLAIGATIRFRLWATK